MIPKAIHGLTRCMSRWVGHERREEMAISQML